MEVCQSATCTVTSRLASLPIPCICGREARKIGSKSVGYRHPNESLLTPPGLPTHTHDNGRGILRTIHQDVLPQSPEAYEFGNLLTLSGIREDLTQAMRITSSVQLVEQEERRARVTRKYLGADGNPIPEWYNRDSSIEEKDTSPSYYLWMGRRLTPRQWRCVKCSLLEEVLRRDEVVLAAINLLHQGENVTLVGQLRCREVTNEGIVESYTSDKYDAIKVVEAVIQHWSDSGALPWMSEGLTSI